MSGARLNGARLRFGFVEVRAASVGLASVKAHKRARDEGDLTRSEAQRRFRPRPARVPGIPAFDGPRIA